MGVRSADEGASEADLAVPRQAEEGSAEDSRAEDSKAEEAEEDSKVAGADLGTYLSRMFLSILADTNSGLNSDGGMPPQSRGFDGPPNGGFKRDFGGDSGPGGGYGDNKRPRY